MLSYGLVVQVWGARETDGGAENHDSTAYYRARYYNSLTGRFLSRDPQEYKPIDPEEYQPLKSNRETRGQTERFLLSCAVARLARVVAVDVPHHVTQRGNARQYILDSDADRMVYLDLLRRYAQCMNFPWLAIA
jgi:hypothetical protein